MIAAFRRLLRPHVAIREQNARIDALERERDAYRKAVDGAFEAIPLDSATIGLELPQCVEHLATAWESSRATCDKLKEEVDALKAEARKHRETAQDRIAERDSARREVERLKGEAQRLWQERDAARDELEAFKLGSATVREHFEAVQEDNRRLKQRLVAANSAIDLVGNFREAIANYGRRLDAALGRIPAEQDTPKP